jgi:hypothetical protein
MILIPSTGKENSFRILKWASIEAFLLSSESDKFLVQISPLTPSSHPSDKWIFKDYDQWWAKGPNDQSYDTDSIS